MNTNTVSLECDALELNGLLEELKARIAGPLVMPDTATEVLDQCIALSDKLANGLADAQEAGVTL